MIDEFLSRWAYVRGMTTEFLSDSTDECLDFRPADDFATIREQAAHLSEVQGVYQLALRGEEPDFGRKQEYAPTSTSTEAILTALKDRDRELADALDQLRPVETDARVAWYGNDMTIAGFGSVFIQHESIHHGQWAAYAALGGHARPTGWLLDWGL